MDTATRPRELDRRKQVRLRVRADLHITPQKYEGKTCHVVKDPVSLRYYRFNEQEFYVIQQFDGKHTLDETQKAFELEFRPHRLTLEDLEHFSRQLLQAGLVQHETPGAGKQLFTQRSKQKKMRRIAAWSNILYIKLPIFDPDRILKWMLPKLSWMFTRWFLYASVAFMLSAVVLVTTHFQTFYDKLPNYQEFFRFHTLLYMWLALGVVKVIHEFGHGLSCKAFGGECHEMGALFLCFSPCLYCNVSDSWTLPNKWHRILISFAGIYVELIIAAAATWLWWYTPNHPFVNNIALCLMVLCSVSTFVFNANPLMRFDGYYMLADWMEIPNLRDRANRLLKQQFQEKCLGMELPPEPYMEPLRQVQFIFYALVSWVYRWVVTFSILYFFYTWLKPYKLDSISALLAFASVASMIGWPSYRMVKGYRQRGRLPDMKRSRVIATASVFAALLAVFFLVPLPISRVQDKGLVQVHPEYLTMVSPSESARLTELLVKNGDFVRAGQTLARFEEPDLTVELTDAKKELDMADGQVKTLKVMMRQPGNAADRIQTIQRDLTSALGDHSKRKDTFEALQRREARVKELSAPRDGYVMGYPRKEEVNKFWDKADQKPFCEIGDPQRLQVMLPVVPGDFRILAEDFAADRDLAVSIRIPGRGNTVFQGRIFTLPQAAAEQVPIQLTVRGGGSLAVKPSENPNVMVPQAQHYLVVIELLNHDKAICPGTLAEVKVHCRWQTGAWRIWRWLANLFDGGLL